MFAGELDMLWFRLAHMADLAYKHVIIEAVRTHRGVPREPWVPQHLGCCLAPVADKVVSLVVDFPPSITEPWAREHYQRDAIWRAITAAHAGDLRPTDLLLLADVDEIPSAQALEPRDNAVCALRQRTFHSAVDWEYPEPQLTSVILRAGNFSSPNTLSAIRDYRYHLPVIEDAGWHFSWLGTREERRKKLEERTCHTEMPEAEWVAIGTGATWEHGLHMAPDSQVMAVQVDGAWPAYIRERRCPPHWFRPRGSND